MIVSVKIRQKRNKTAKEIAEKFSVSERTVRRYVAEHRNAYEERAEKRREIAYNLRLQGKKWKEVGDMLDCSAEAARALYRRYIEIQEQRKKEALEEKNKTNNFDLFIDSPQASLEP